MKLNASYDNIRYIEDFIDIIKNKKGIISYEFESDILELQRIKDNYLAKTKPYKLK